MADAGGERGGGHVDRQNSAITPDQVKAKLMRTAWRGFPAYDDHHRHRSDDWYHHHLHGVYAIIFTIGAGQVDHLGGI